MKTIGYSLACIYLGHSWSECTFMVHDLGHCLISLFQVWEDTLRFHLIIIYHQFKHSCTFMGQDCEKQIVCIVKLCPLGRNIMPCHDFKYESIGCSKDLLQVYYSKNNK